jgi:hypothetical protein
VSKGTFPGEITGRIVATPNPIPFGEGSKATISWQTTDPAGAEVRVLTPTGGEKLVSRGNGGSVEVPWIQPRSRFEFRLYSGSEPSRLLDRVTVRHNDGSWGNIFDSLASEPGWENVHLTAVANYIAKVIPRCLNHPQFRDLFLQWERHGFHVTPVHFYQPIPDTRTLTDAIWAKPGNLAGVDMNEDRQLDLLRNVFPQFRNEYDAIPRSATGKRGEFYFDNGQFSGTDALVNYCMVRHFQPRLIIEVGSGFSSLITAQAAVKNKSSSLVCVEPFPLDFLVAGFPGLASLVQKPVQDIELDFFSKLESGDILFIDSSHTVKIGGDVNYLFLEVLPRLKPGVIVHVHDIRFPLDYGREWVLGEFRFWAEQYLLQAFLAFNSEFEVLICNSYLGFYFPEELKSCFPHSPWWGGGSFWMRRRESRPNELQIPSNSETLSH